MVDDAIVMIENIARHLEQRAKDGEAQEGDWRAAALAAMAACGAPSSQLNYLSNHRPIASGVSSSPSWKQPPGLSHCASG